MEETIQSMLTSEVWDDLKDSDGRIVDKQYVLKVRMEHILLIYSCTCTWYMYVVSK